MKKARKNAIIIFGISLFTAFILLGSVLYITRYRVTVVDTVRSKEGTYEAVLQAVGDPAWPFGSAPGRLVLKKDGRTLSKTDIEIANDGGRINDGNWKVAWRDDRAEITLSGQEQYDELVKMYYGGQVESCQLTTFNGAEVESTYNNAEEQPAEPETEGELFPGEEQITAGYKAVYEFCAASAADDFEVYFGAKESSSRCILSEDEDTVEYLTYSGRSQNEKCGIYVRYQNKKNADGAWNNTEGTIMDIYAYVYESGDVMSSGKTAWEDIGSEAYQEVTGEKQDHNFPHMERD